MEEITNSILNENLPSDKIPENYSSFLKEEDLYNLDIMLKSCKFGEIVIYLKSEVIPNLNIQTGDYFVQIILIIYIFCLLKLQKYDNISEVLNKFKFIENKEILLFPLRFLEAKYYYMINDVCSAINNFYRLLSTYSNSESSTNKNLILIEENSDFKFFREFFVNLFAIKNNHNKIKKCYFEIKNCFVKLGLAQEAYRIIETCNMRFPDDIIVSYELLKQSLILSNFQKVEEMFVKIKEIYIKFTDEENKQIFENYLNFAEALTWLSKGEYEIAKNKLTEILRNNSDDVIIVNNIAALNLYMNKADRSYLDFKIILDREQMNNFNEVTFGNINVLTDIFNLPKYP